MVSPVLGQEVPSSAFRAMPPLWSLQLLLSEALAPPSRYLSMTTSTHPYHPGLKKPIRGDTQPPACPSQQPEAGVGESLPHGCSTPSYLPRAGGVTSFPRASGAGAPSGCTCASLSLHPSTGLATVPFQCANHCFLSHLSVSPAAEESSKERTALSFAVGLELGTTGKAVASSHTTNHRLGGHCQAEPG